MTPAFSVQTTSHFDRAFRKLARHHLDLVEHYAHALSILASDPYNFSRSHPIRKLEGTRPVMVSSGSDLAASAPVWGKAQGLSLLKHSQLSEGGFRANEAEAGLALTTISHGC